MHRMKDQPLIVLHLGSSKFGVTRCIFSQSTCDEVQYKKRGPSNNAWAIYAGRLARSKGRVPLPLLISWKEDNLLLAIFLWTPQHLFLLLLSKVERSRQFALACSPEYGLYVTWFPRNRMSRDSHVTIWQILHHHSLVHFKNHVLTKSLQFFILLVLCGIQQ